MKSKHKQYFLNYVVNESSTSDTTTRESQQAGKYDDDDDDDDAQAAAPATPVTITPAAMALERALFGDRRISRVLFKR